MAIDFPYLLAETSKKPDVKARRNEEKVKSEKNKVLSVRSTRPVPYNTSKHLG